MSCNSTNSSSNPTSSFPNAGTMETLATNLPIVWEEICAIQQAILAASSQCQAGGGRMYTTVGGNTPMTFVSGVNSVSVVSGGTGYYQDSPAVKFIPPNGSSGHGATGTVITNGGNILGIAMTAGGTGYQPVYSTLSVVGGGPQPPIDIPIIGITVTYASGAVLRPVVNAAGNIVDVEIINGGTGYTTDYEVVATRAVVPTSFVFDAVFSITSVSVTGAIEEVIILNPGTGYQPSFAQVQIVSSLNNDLPYPTGTGFIADVLTDTDGAIIQVLVRNHGAGYAVFPPYLFISNPGTGAQTSVTLTGTAVSSIAVTNSGSNYSLPISGTVFNPPTASLPNPPATPAVVTINIANNTYGTNPNLYWQVWAGTTTNKAIQVQLNSVLSYFIGLGYTIQIQSNPATGSTIQWYVSW